MKYYIIPARSLTYAQRMTRLLKNAGIMAAIIRQSVSSGCSYGVKVKKAVLDRALKLLEEAGFDIPEPREEEQ